MSLREDGRAISFFGDLHPSFAGNVVKAMASAKQGYPVVSRMLSRQAPSNISPQALIACLNEELRATVHEVHRLTPTIVEVVVRAPMAARAFEPGQFYRLQNFETLSRSADGTRLAMEGLALTGASVDREQGLLSTIVLEMGGSSDLCALLKPGEPVVLMGPTGHADRDAVRRNRAADRRRARQRRAVLDRPGVARQRQPRDLFRRLQARDRPLQGRGDRARGRRRSSGAATRRRASAPTRPQDKAFVGNIVEALDAYGSGALGDAADPARRRRPRDRDRLRRHDGGGRRARPASSRSISSPAIRRSPPSTRRCSA